MNWASGKKKSPKIPNSFKKEKEYTLSWTRLIWPLKIWSSKVTELRLKREGYVEGIDKKRNFEPDSLQSCIAHKR